MATHTMHVAFTFSPKSNKSSHLSLKTYVCKTMRIVHNHALHTDPFLPFLGFLLSPTPLSQPPIHPPSIPHLNQLVRPFSVSPLSSSLFLHAN